MEFFMFLMMPVLAQFLLESTAHGFTITPKKFYHENVTQLLLRELERNSYEFWNPNSFVFEYQNSSSASTIKVRRRRQTVNERMHQISSLRLPTIKALIKYAANPKRLDNLIQSFRTAPYVRNLLDSLYGNSARSGRSHLEEDKEYCFGEIGCFTITRQFYHPVIRPMNFPPQSRDEINTHFVLYSRERPHGVNIGRYHLQDFKTSSFTATRPTKIIVHGWMTPIDFRWMTDMAAALMDHGDYNIIIVHWTDGSNLLYNFVLLNALVVTLEIISLIKYLEQNHALARADVHFIAHSLGTHIVGYVGQRMEGIGRISALDPARPYFQGMPEDVRLDPSDARFVDVIHSDSSFDMSETDTYGSGELSGHVDFFPNGGNDQPGCRLFESPAGPFCDHDLSQDIFISSLRSKCPFIAFPCESYEDFRKGLCYSCEGPEGCAPMGMNANKWNPNGRSEVKMFITTSDEPEFCLYHYKVTLHLPRGRTRGSYVYGNLDISLMQGIARRKTFHPTKTGPIKLEMGSTASFILRHREDHSRTDGVIIHWQSVDKFPPCRGECVPHLQVASASFTPLDDLNVFNHNRTVKSFCPLDNSSSVTVSSGRTAKLRESPGCRP